MACATPKFGVESGPPGTGTKSPIGGGRYGRSIFGTTPRSADGSNRIGTSPVGSRCSVPNACTGLCCSRWKGSVGAHVVCYVLVISLSASYFENWANAAEGKKRAKAQRVYGEKEKHFRDEPKKPEPAWQFGRAC